MWWQRKENEGAAFIFILISWIQSEYEKEEEKNQNYWKSWILKSWHSRTPDRVLWLQQKSDDRAQETRIGPRCLDPSLWRFTVGGTCNLTTHGLGPPHQKTRTLRLKLSLLLPWSSSSLAISPHKLQSITLPAGCIRNIALHCFDAG